MLEFILVAFLSFMAFLLILGLGATLGFIVSVALFSGSKVLLIVVLILRILLVQETFAKKEVNDASTK